MSAELSVLTVLTVLAVTVVPVLAVASAVLVLFAEHPASRTAESRSAAATDLNRFMEFSPL
jgi:hypothetical protein